MLPEYKFKSKGTDAEYLVNSNIFISAVFTLTIFKQRWHEDKLGSQEGLEKSVGWFKETFEGGRTGNRFHIAARKEARKALNVSFQKILNYLAIFAEESDITVMLNSGVVTKKSAPKGRRAAKSVPAT